MMGPFPLLSKAGALLAILMLSGLPGCGDRKPLPPRQGRVNDYAGVLDKADAAALEQKLDRYEAETCHQFVVLIVPSLDGEEIAGFSSRIVEGWKIGHPLLKNGLLLTVSLDEGKARIDTGTGLEDFVATGRAEEILRREMLPLFGMDRMGEGITRGVEACMEEGRKVSFPPEIRPPVCRTGG